MIGPGAFPGMRATLGKLVLVHGRKGYPEIGQLRIGNLDNEEAGFRQFSVFRYPILDFTIFYFPTTASTSGVWRLSFVTSTQPVSMACSIFSPRRCFTAVVTPR